MDSKEFNGKIYVKQELSWYIIDSFLENIRPLGDAMSDEEFRKSFEKMRKVVDYRMKLPTNNYVDHCYVVVEQIKDKY